MAVAYAAELASSLLHNLTMQPNPWAMQGVVAGVGTVTQHSEDLSVPETVTCEGAEAMRVPTLA
jgi:hypothetical protein